MRFQLNFSKMDSTDTCLVRLTDYIKLENDKGNFTGMVLLLGALRPVYNSIGTFSTQIK